MTKRPAPSSAVNDWLRRAVIYYFAKPNELARLVDALQAAWLLRSNP